MTVIIDGTNGITNATWTTAGRPSSPNNGEMGYNSTLDQFEIYFTTAGWTKIASGTYSANYLIVAGGGGGGVAGTQDYSRGGGGAGARGGVSATSGSGGSGTVVISYTGSQRGTGGTVTSSGGNTIHTFTSSGTYTA
jgi:hypothetical protein